MTTIICFFLVGLLVGFFTLMAISFENRQRFSKLNYFNRAGYARELREKGHTGYEG